MLEVHDEIAAHIQNSLEEVKYIDGVSSNEDSEEEEGHTDSDEKEEKSEDSGEEVVAEYGTDAKGVWEQAGVAEEAELVRAALQGVHPLAPEGDGEISPSFSSSSAQDEVQWRTIAKVSPGGAGGFAGDRHEGFGSAEAKARAPWAARLDVHGQRPGHSPRTFPC